ncbi:MAG: SRPBCC domain-containing protein [Hyphomicrobium sp.]|uniref:SRPBCC family protein n=1 Tax=Hyphomicrobium sp. TaxID=82 RepID=UPI0035692A78
MTEIRDSIEPFVLVRVFDAPRELVFKAFTEVEHLRQWWGPKGFKVIAATMDFRSGGLYHYGLQAPDGTAMWGRFAYREIAAPERIDYVNSFSDEKGGLARHVFHEEWPLEILSTLAFEDVGSGRTKVTLSWVPINENAVERKTFDAGRQSMTQGWGGTFEKLDHYLAEVQAGDRKV